MMMMMMISLFPNYVFPDLYALSGHEFNINFFLRACRAIKITWHFTASDDFGSSLLSEANYLSGLQKKMSIYFVLTVFYVKKYGDFNGIGVP